MRSVCGLGLGDALGGGAQRDRGVEAIPVVTTPAVAAAATDDSITVLRSTLRGARLATTDERDLRCFGTCLPDV